MMSFLLILVCSFFAPFQCERLQEKNLNSFFVTRIDSTEAICVQSQLFFSPVFPTFNLDKLQIPPNVGFMHWDWLSDWQLQNDTDVRKKGGAMQMLIAADHPFLFAGRGGQDGFPFYTLASSISVWMVSKNGPRGAGMLFELDHWNAVTKLKETTIKYCDQYPEDEGMNCSIVDYKNGTNFLDGGNRWTWFWIVAAEKSPARVEIFEISYGNWNSIGQWKANSSANITNPFTSRKFDIFVKSHQRNAALLIDSVDEAPDLANNREMKRKYKKRSSGELCVEVWWNKSNSNGSIEVKNLVSGRVEPAANKSRDGANTYFRWNHLDAGEYEITLRFDYRKPENINLCTARDSNIVKTWTSIPKAITKCQFDVGIPDEFSARPSSTSDPTLKPNWSLEEWAHVCDRLRIGSNEAEVPIKFCNFYGCNFGKCPHLQG